MKSETCFGKMYGQPLSEYYTEEDAQSAAEYSREHFGNDLTPYNCAKCGLWHLSPRYRQTPSKKCHCCTGRDGLSKDAYRSKREARQRADIIYLEHGISLRAYKCKYGSGWHLTKSDY
ncbi:hypothetical protein H2O73_01220 [Vibrio sp. 404]|uniref:Uncharacterized protein n=1 Tax=Vibrio marinisediminis TaxID=2758441 RepID=A0A7W2IS45_9VIBR|nr:hypothetical protein [Vibrio marinisediminis]MBA5760945.1 hypothetical protein [Vibrio marinisediminis]